jgi:hypothetical protein
VLLNNDTEIIQPEWLERMIGIAQRPEVGAVGIRLVYPESGCIQHAGIVLGLPGGVLSVADHVFEQSELDAPGYMNRLLTEQNYSAVTAACLMVAKDKYLAVGGFDAEQLTVLFNDVDFCLKLQQQGLLNVLRPMSPWCTTMPRVSANSRTNLPLHWRRPCANSRSWPWCSNAGCHNWRMIRPTTATLPSVPRTWLLSRRAIPTGCRARPGVARYWACPFPAAVASTACRCPSMPCRKAGGWM